MARRLLTRRSKVDLWPSHCSGSCNWQDCVMGCLFGWPFPQADTRLDSKWSSCLLLMFFLRHIEPFRATNPSRLVARNHEWTFLLVFKMKPEFYGKEKKMQNDKKKKENMHNDELWCFVFCRCCPASSKNTFNNPLWSYGETAASSPTTVEQTCLLADQSTLLELCCGRGLR